MIGVGVNYGLILMTVELIQDKYTALAFTFKETGEGNAEEKDAFEALAGDEMVNTASGTVIRRFGPGKVFDKTKDGKPIPHQKQVDAAMESLGEVKNTLIQSLLCYMTTEKAKINMFQGMESVINKTNYSEMIIQEEIINTAFVTMCNQYIELVTPFLAKPEYPINVILVRQSKAKHFPELRKYYVMQNPVFENGAIPKEASKLKFTPGEISQGLDNPNPVSQAAADVDTSNTTQADVDALFNQPEGS